MKNGEMFQLALSMVAIVFIVNPVVGEETYSEKQDNGRAIDTAVNEAKSQDKSCSTVNGKVDCTTTTKKKTRNHKENVSDQTKTKGDDLKDKAD